VTNTDLREAWDYHERTKHSPERLRATRHVLDWEIQPLPFKIYPGLEPIPLPRDVPDSGVPALDALQTSVGDEATFRPTLATLARWLRFSAGVTRRVIYPGGREMVFRAAACTGALYHIDAYLVCGALPGLDAGVYHFGAHDFALRRLRAGDYRALVIEASGNEPAIATAPAIAVLTSTFWRNAWKYQTRAYRHCFWDSGTILANGLAIAAADGMPARIVLGFVDRTINQLLALDTEREVALALVALGHDAAGAPGPAPAAPPLGLETMPLSSREIDYPAMRAMHEASSLVSPEEAERWHGTADLPAPPAPTGETTALRALADPPAESIEDVIRRRGSTREFARAAITAEQLATLMTLAAAPIPTDVTGPHASRLGDVYLIVHATDGVAAGTWVLHPDGRELELLRAGELRREAGFLGLGQELPADAAANVFFLTALTPLLERFGNRGYRVAQLEAAIRGGRVYLGAYAMRLGATGLTYFDDSVTDFFSPHAAGKSVMFLVAVGRGKKRELRVTQ
jgi:SagB-type dehydrogenase family enzyme